MTWLDMAITLAKQFEGCSLGAYPDPEYGWKRPTIGYGATGPSITQGTVWTQVQADADLHARMRGVGAHIDALVSAPISDEQKGALCDLTYNIGLTAFSNSTLLTKLNEGDVQGAADQFQRWDMSDGHELAGLARRRDAEHALFILGANLSGEPLTQQEQT